MGHLAGADLRVDELEHPLHLHRPGTLDQQAAQAWQGRQHGVLQTGHIGKMAAGPKTASAARRQRAQGKQGLNAVLAG